MIPLASHTSQPSSYITDDYPLPYIVQPSTMNVYVNYQSNYHVHSNMYEIYLFLEGDVSFYIDEKLFELEKGNLMIIGPGTIHKAFINSPDSYRRLILQITEIELQQRSTQYTDYPLIFSQHQNQLFKVSAETLSFLSDLSANIYELFENSYIKKIPPQFGEDLLLHAYLNIYLTHIGKLVQEETIQEFKHEDPLVANIVSYIDKNLTTLTNVQEIADHMHMSKSRICERFVQYYKTSIWDYVITKRLVLSQKYLLQGKNVSDSCYLSGYNDYAHYLKTFKKKFGTSPKRFQKNAQEAREAWRYIEGRK